MKLLKTLIAVLTTVTLAISVVGVGFYVCTLPPTTKVLAGAFSRDDLSPFSREQLVWVAEATRDFSFGSHNELALYQTIYSVNKELENGASQTSEALPKGFPQLDAVTDLNSISAYKTAFSSASEAYCYSSDAISHLNDCYQIAATAYPSLIAMLGLAVAGMASLALPAMREDESYRRLANTIQAAGGLVVVVLIALGAWAVVDFNGIFTVFHELMFAAQGNWTFPVDSLLICALPEAFWMGMGAVGLAAAVLLSLVLFFLGFRLKKLG